MFQRFFLKLCSCQRLTFCFPKETGEEENNLQCDIASFGSKAQLSCNNNV